VTNAGVRTITLPQFIVDVLVDHLGRWSTPYQHVHRADEAVPGQSRMRGPDHPFLTLVDARGPLH
jgi:hypothetical protein